MEVYEDSLNLEVISLSLTKYHESTLKELASLESLATSIKQLRSSLLSSDSEQASYFQLSPPSRNLGSSDSSSKNTLILSKSSIKTPISVQISSEVVNLKQIVSDLIKKLVTHKQNTQEHTIKLQSTKIKVLSRNPEPPSLKKAPRSGSQSNKFLPYMDDCTGIYISSVLHIQKRLNNIGEQEANMPLLSNSVINWIGSLRI